MSYPEYELFEHTADLGVIFYGKSREEVFENAAYALADIMVGVENLKEDEEYRIRVSSFDRDELFIDWLRELIYIFTVKEFLFKRCKVESMEETEVDALLMGERRKDHRFKKEIKTPTYHQYVFEKVDGIWRARVIFDV